MGGEKIMTQQEYESRPQSGNQECKPREEEMGKTKKKKAKAGIKSIKEYHYLGGRFEGSFP